MKPQVRRLVETAAALRNQTSTYFSITRLTGLKSLCSEPERAAQFVLHLAEELIRVLVKDQNPPITRVAVLATCGTGGQPGTIKDARATIRGRIEGKVAYNERGTQLGEYRDGKTYTAGGQLFGYGNLLPALIANDAKRRGVWS